MNARVPIPVPGPECRQIVIAQEENPLRLEKKGKMTGRVTRRLQQMHALGDFQVAPYGNVVQVVIKIGAIINAELITGYIGKLQFAHMHIEFRLLKQAVIPGMVNMQVGIDWAGLNGDLERLSNTSKKQHAVFRRLQACGIKDVYAIAHLPLSPPAYGDVPFQTDRWQDAAL